MTKGIDLSRHNGEVGFSRVKADGYKFVILRAGYGKEISQKDSTFEANYKHATAVGLNVGAYWYSYAQTPAEALLEAKTFVEVLKNKQFSMPVYVDIEENSVLSRGEKIVSAIADTFIKYMESAGYYCGLYMSRSPMISCITDTIQKSVSLWIAEYGTSCTYKAKGGVGTVGMWQKSSTGSVNGITGNVDIDECYVDYPSIIKKACKNGFTATTTTKVTTTTTATKTVEQIAKEVIAGKWGVNPVRKQKLEKAGYNYEAVQALVNQMMKNK